MTEPRPQIATSLAVPARAGASLRARLSRAAACLRKALTLRAVLFTMMLTVATVPIAGFYHWIARSSFDRELALVDQSHLVIARNLSAALSRYVTDATALFDLAVANRDALAALDGVARALANFHFRHIFVLDAQGREQGRLEVSGGIPVPPPALLEDLRALAESSAGRTRISGISAHAGSPHFFMVRALPGGGLAYAPLSPRYVVDLQKSISFGKRGHSMVVDHRGRVVAHPDPEWQRVSKDASRLPVVQAMLAGETGVMQFHSPPPGGPT